MNQQAPPDPGLRFFRIHLDDLAPDAIGAVSKAAMRAANTNAKPVPVPESESAPRDRA